MGTASQSTEESSEDDHCSTMIYLIGDLRVITPYGKADWKIARLGVHQIKRMVSYLVAKVEHPIARSDLAAIGSPNWPHIARPSNLTSGLKQWLRRWGMLPALIERENSMMLIRHRCWSSDTDQMEALAEQANEHLANHNTSAAIHDLQQAAAFCGGRYLPDYDKPDYPLNNLQTYWESFQRDIIYRLSDLLMQHSAYSEALKVARKLIHLGGDEPNDHNLLADIFAALGSPHRANYHRRKASDEDEDFPEHDTAA